MIDLHDYDDQCAIVDLEYHSVARYPDAIQVVTDQRVAVRGRGSSASRPIAFRNAPNGLPRYAAEILADSRERPNPRTSQIVPSCASCFRTPSCAIGRSVRRSQGYTSGTLITETSLTECDSIVFLFSFLVFLLCPSPRSSCYPRWKRSIVTPQVALGRVH